MEKRKNGQSGAKSFAVCEPLSLLLRQGGRICINYEAFNVGPLDAQPMGGSSFSSNEKVESGVTESSKNKCSKYFNNLDSVVCCLSKEFPFVNG